MIHSCNIYLLSLLFTCSVSSDIQKSYSNRTIVPSRSIYDLVQLRRAAARWAALHNITHRNNHTYDDSVSASNVPTYLGKSKFSDLQDNRHRYLIQRLKLIIIISSITMVFMIVLVITCIIARYVQSKDPMPTERLEQKTPLNPPNRTRYVQKTSDTRNFSRKSRTISTQV